MQFYASLAEELSRILPGILLLLVLSAIRLAKILPALLSLLVILGTPLNPPAQRG